MAWLLGAICWSRYTDRASSMGPLFLRVLEALAKLACQLPVVFPIHPRARARSDAFLGLPRLQLISPVGYVDFLALETNAAGVSGGVQEETTYLRVPCFTLRANTERPITLTLGTNRLLGVSPEAVAGIPAALEKPPVSLHLPDGWDGQASGRVADVLLAAAELAGPRNAYGPLAVASSARPSAVG